MRFDTIAFTALTATMVAAAPGAKKANVFDLAARDGAILSIGTSGGCGAYCYACGAETCTCGNNAGTSKPPCCNGYASTGKNLPGCAGPAGNPNTKRAAEPTKKA
ncbi:hypothetical protein B0A55_02222 [Friedmanniomyces simplex]|uniref:Uncharacterized protein n=1 Tax=Friedmanniomyces simplex TaxID=329884 RepID=A0A4U0XUG4_9PEZI|nr:hypothetical protein B0A55_02222 [Friedmanniomyces simplex]